MPQAYSSNLKSGLSKNLNIGVLLGGTSSERQISLRSGRAIHQALSNLGFSAHALDPKDPSDLELRIQKMDLAFIALHGKGGEDGKIQRQLEKWKVPYVGSDATGSRCAFDKKLSKQIFLKSGIPTAPFTFITASNWQKKLARFPMPCFIKPPCEGSSIGAFPVEDLSKSVEKIKQAIRDYGELLVEQKIEGREFTVGILGQKALPVIELVPKRKFYDFRAKYTKGMTDYRVPAPIAESLRKKLQKIALQAHHALGLRDFSRVDIMTDKKNRPYVLEANSIPGFTALSLLPKAAKTAGISFEELCARLLTFAYQRKARR